MSDHRAEALVLNHEADTRSAVRASRPRRKRLAVDARRAELIELGFELFRAYAYDSLSVEQIAVHARISKGLLYHYFQSKREYYLQVVRALAEEFVANARKLVHLGSTEELDAGLDEFLDYARSRRALIEGLMRGAFGTADEVSKIIEITRREIVDALLADLGEQTPSMRNALRGWVQFAERTIMAWVDHEEVAKPELRRLLIATALHAMELARNAEFAHHALGMARRESAPARGLALESVAGSA
jgi:AcrR family transcriptional regulator